MCQSHRQINPAPFASAVGRYRSAANADLNGNHFARLRAGWEIPALPERQGLSPLDGGPSGASVDVLRRGAYHVSLSTRADFGPSRIQGALAQQSGGEQPLAISTTRTGDAALQAEEDVAEVRLRP